MTLAEIDEMEEFRSSCSVYLDLFHAVKGRIREYYQSGGKKDCTAYWNDFWFCLRLKYTDQQTAVKMLEGRRHSGGLVNSTVDNVITPVEAGIWELK